MSKRNAYKNLPSAINLKKIIIDGKNNGYVSEKWKKKNRYT